MVLTSYAFILPRVDSALLGGSLLFYLSAAKRLLAGNSVYKAAIPKGTSRRVIDSRSTGPGAHGFPLLCTLPTRLNGVIFGVVPGLPARTKS